MTGIIMAHKGVVPKIHPSAFIAENAVVIGDVEIGAESSIWYGCVVRGDTNQIRIGARTNIQDGTVIHVNGDVSEPLDMATHIGDDVTVGHMCLIHAATLKDRSFVGMKGMVMDQAVVEEEGMLAGGAVLTPRKRIEKGQLWAGSPAKYLRDVRPEEWKHLFGISKHYVENSRDFMDERRKGTHLIKELRDAG